MKYFTTVDKLPASDKQKHAIIGWRIALASYAFCRLIIELTDWNMIYVQAWILPVIGAGIWKEYDDSKNPEGTSEWGDFWYTIKQPLAAWVMVMLTLI